MSQQSRDKSRTFAGVLWMLAAGLNFVAMTAVVKHLGPVLPAAEAAFLRYVLGLVFLLPVLRPLLRLRLGSRGLMLVSARGVVHTIGVIAWFYAMARIPLAEVTAINYLNPVFVTLGAALFLGERLNARRLAAIGVALVGAGIILRPGFREISSGHAAMLATAMMLAASYLFAGRLSETIGPALVVALLSVSVTIGLTPFAIAVWVPPSALQLAWLFVMAGFATAGHYAMTQAFRAAPMSVIQPVSFLQLVWATLLGWLVFNEAVDIWVIVGAGLILTAVSFITWREAMLRRRAVTPLVDAVKV